MNKENILLTMSLSLLILTTMGTIRYFNEESKKEETIEVPESIKSKIPNPLPEMPYQDLIDALIWVESNGNPVAYGDLHLGEPSVGILQIRKVMVDDVNRILSLQGKSKRYIYTDRYDQTKSLEMFVIYVKHYHGGFDDYEAIARTWNGGPLGTYKKSTEKYWEKVNTQLTSTR